MIELRFTNDLKKRWLTINFKAINIFGLVITTRKNLIELNAILDGGETLYLLANENMRKKSYYGELEKYY